MAVKKGDKVKVEYTGTLDDGTVFDSSEKQGKPIEFEVGSGQIIQGFDQAVEGMEKGEEKEITLQPNEAYGDYNPEMVKQVPNDQLPNEAEEGSTLLMQLPNGNQMPVKVVEKGESESKLDLNHPLTGKKLHFKIKVLEVEPASEAAEASA